MYYLGIDPGVGGAFALICADFIDENRWMAYAADMPYHTLIINKQKRRKVDLAGVVHYLQQNAAVIEHAFVENPHSMPKQGVVSAFSFGYGCGAVQMAVQALKIPYTLVDPSAWKIRMKLTADKEQCRRRASELFVNGSSQWPKRGDADRAEAALIAYYGVKALLKK